MIPAKESYAAFQRQAYREAAEAGIRFHGERHAYAQARYESLVKVPCPVGAGVKHGRAHHKHLTIKLEVSIREARAIDQAARLQIAEELGHGRIEVTNAYLG